MVRLVTPPYERRTKRLERALGVYSGGAVTTV
jgi:hypothetical protein